MSTPRVTGQSVQETASPGRLPPVFLDRLSGSSSGSAGGRLSYTSSPRRTRWLHCLLVQSHWLACWRCQWLIWSHWLACWWCWWLIWSHWLARWRCWSLIWGNRSARPLLADREHSLISARRWGPWIQGPWVCGLSTYTSTGG